MTTQEEISDLFASVAAALSNETWYRLQNWEHSQHIFPPHGLAEGITFQLSKPHWYNQDRQGIHLESFLDFRPAKQKKTVLTLHLLHLPVIPGTALKRKVLAKQVVDALRPEIENWQGYIFRTGSYGQQPFSLHLDATAPEFEQVLVQEFARLAQFVGPHIDRALQELGLR